MMQRNTLEAAFRRGLPWGLLGLLLLTCLDILDRYLWLDPWNFGDWLINYAGGFTRRGLSGEIALWLSASTGLDPGAFIALAQIVSYALFFGLSYQLLKKEERLLPYGLLVISPFLFAFQLTGECHRKEIVLIALFAGLVWLARKRGAAAFEKGCYLALGLFPLLILSHEALAIFLPYFLVLFVQIVPLTRARAWACIALCALNLGVFGAICLSPPVPPAGVEAVVHRLAEHGYPVSGTGAIQWINRTAEYGRQHVIHRLATRQYILYLPMLLLAGVAFAPVVRRLKPIFQRPLTATLIATTFLGTAFLCYTAVDWGRYLYIHAALLFLLTFVHPVPLPIYPRLPLRAALAAAFCYSAFWYIPHVGPQHLHPPSYFSYNNFTAILDPAAKIWSHLAPSSGQQ